MRQKVIAGLGLSVLVLVVLLAVGLGLNQPSAKTKTEVISPSPQSAPQMESKPPLPDSFDRLHTGMTVSEFDQTLGVEGQVRARAGDLSKYEWVTGGHVVRARASKGRITEFDVE